MVCKILERSSYEAVEAADGQQALRLLDEQTFDAILTDWMMPIMDGLELIRSVRAKVRPCPPIIMFTSLESDDAFEAAFRAGADDYLAKPINPKQLLVRLESVVTRYRQAAALGRSRESVAADPLPKSARHLPRREGRGTVPLGTRIRVSEQVGTLPTCVGGIAASTGGARAVAALFDTFDRQVLDDAIITVVLHEPDEVRQGLGARYYRDHGLPIRMVTREAQASPGSIYFAMGEDRHLVVEAKNGPVFRLVEHAPHNHMRPSADWLFRSIASAFGRYGIAIVLTGLGSDGARGAEHVARAGGVVLVQQPETAERSAMPQSVVNLVPTARPIALADLGATLSRYIGELSRLLEHARE